MFALTLEMVSGWLKSFPPVMRNPQGAGPSNTILSGMALQCVPRLLGKNRTDCRQHSGGIKERSTVTVMETLNPGGGGGEQTDTTQGVTLLVSFWEQTPTLFHQNMLAEMEFNNVYLVLQLSTICSHVMYIFIFCYFKASLLHF